MSLFFIAYIYTFLRDPADIVHKSAIPLPRILQYTKTPQIFSLFLKLGPL